MNYKAIFYSLVLVAIGITACQKDDLKQDVPLNETFDPTWGTGKEVPIISSFYFKGKIDTVLTVFQDSILGYKTYVDSVSYGPCDTNRNVVGQVAGLKDTLTGRGIEFKILECLVDTADSTVNRDVVYMGTYPYGNSDAFSLIEGVEIEWTDAAGDVWTSRSGTGANQNFSFELSEVLDHAVDDTLSDLYVKGRMDLMLYKGPSSIRVENAEFRFRLGKF